MKRFAPLLLLLATACGTPPPPATPVPPPPKEAKEKPAYPASREPLFVEFVTIERRWVTKYVPDGADDVKAWAETAKVEPSFYWILVKVDPKTGDAPAKAKAQKLLERTKKEPFAKVAHDSDDPGSRERGGEYAAAHVKGFVKEVQDAFAPLKPGETSAVFKSSFGWGFVKKDAPSPELLAPLYRDAKSTELTQKLGAEMTKHLRSSPDLRQAIADSVLSVLGDSAVADPDRPKPGVVDRERIKDLKHLSASSKAGLGQFADHARPSDVLDTPVTDKDEVIVARAVAAGG
ncbi:MAG: peptidylprolyl isomerase [Labilithrix sp.]